MGGRVVCGVEGGVVRDMLQGERHVVVYQGDEARVSSALKVPHEAGHPVVLV